MKSKREFTLRRTFLALALPLRIFIYPTPWTGHVFRRESRIKLSLFRDTPATVVVIENRMIPLKI